jgi:hypothetical protein
MTNGTETEPTPEETLDATLTYLTGVVNAIENSEAWKRWNDWLASMNMDEPMNDETRRELTKGKNYDYGKVWSGDEAAAKAQEYVVYWWEREGLEISAATFRNDPVYGSGNVVKDNTFGTFPGGKWPLVDAPTTKD